MTLSKPVLYALFCAGLTFSVVQEAKSAACDPSTTVCLGLPCDTLGLSRMDKGEKNVIICLNPETGTQKIWKSSTTAAATPIQGSHCGYFPLKDLTYGANIDHKVTVSVADQQNAIPCNGYPIQYQNKTFYGGASGTETGALYLTTSCPAEYKFAGISCVKK